MNKPENAPRDALEQALAKAWEKSLAVANIGINDRFQDLGGDSLGMVRVLNELRRQVRLVNAMELLLQPTIAAQATLLRQKYPDIAAALSGSQSTVASWGGPNDSRCWLTEEDVERFAEHSRSLAFTLPVAAVDSAAPNPPVIFILSSSRSGSTLLRVMLAGHSALFSPPELNLLCFAGMSARRQFLQAQRKQDWEKAASGLGDALVVSGLATVAEAKRLIHDAECDDLPTPEMYRRLQQWIKPRILVDKSPLYAYFAAALSRAETCFMNARYIHLVRSPAAAVRSAEELGIATVFTKEGAPPWFGPELAWVHQQRTIERFLQTVPRHRWTRVRFEDLVRDPESSLRGICAFLGLEFEDAVTRPHDGNRMTESVYREGLAEGDPKFNLYRSAVPKAAAGDPGFNAHRQIDPDVVTRSETEVIALSDLTWQEAAKYGYRPGSVEALGVIPQTDRSVPLPLSPEQERAWKFSRRDDAGWSTRIVVSLTGELRIAILEQSLLHVVQRHEILRTIYRSIDGVIRQFVQPCTAMNLPLVDLSATSEREQSLTAWFAEEDAAWSFQEGDPVLRAHLVRLSAQEHLFVMRLHHIAYDANSLGILLRELSTCYEAFANGSAPGLPSLPRQFGDYAVWKRAQAQPESDLYQKQLAYWKGALAVTESLRFPFGRKTPTRPTAGRSRLRYHLPESVSNFVRRPGIDNGTPFATLLAIFALAWSQLSGQKKLLFGAYMSQRDQPEIEGLVGFFSNPVSLCIDLSQHRTCEEVITEVRRITTRAFQHGGLPYNDTIERLRSEGAHAPLIEAYFTFGKEQPMVVEAAGVRFERIKRAAARAVPWGTNFSYRQTTDGRLRGIVRFDNGRFDLQRVRQFVAGLSETMERLLSGGRDGNSPRSRFSWANLFGRRSQ